MWKSSAITWSEPSVLIRYVRLESRSASIACRESGSEKGKKVMSLPCEFYGELNFSYSPEGQESQYASATDRADCSIFIRSVLSWYVLTACGGEILWSSWWSEFISFLSLFEYEVERTGCSFFLFDIQPHFSVSSSVVKLKFWRLEISSTGWNNFKEDTDKSLWVRL